MASPAYLRAHGRPRAPNDLRERDCLVHGDANAATIWRFGTERGKEAPVPVRGRFATNNSEAVLLMARHGLGIALLADWLVRDDLRRGPLVPLLEEFTAPPAPIFALSPPGRFSRATVRSLTDHLAVRLAARLATDA